MTSKASLGDIGPLLDLLGRASTPTVAESAHDTTLGGLAGFGFSATDRDRVLVVASREWLGRLHARTDVVVGIPGMLVEQADADSVTRLVIDQAAFHEGAWIGADSGVSRHLSEEIFEAGRCLRAKGRSVYFLPAPGLVDGVDLPRIASTATVAFGAIPEADLEERAPQSSIWNELAGCFEERLGGPKADGDRDEVAKEWGQ